jgi:DNA excision repair protein ERCC-1
MSAFRPIVVGAVPLKARKSQKGNPLLSHVQRAKLEWCENDALLADYVCKSTGILFLQTSWHRKNPAHIKEQMHKMKNMFKLRILLLHYNEQESDVGSSASTVLEEMNSLCLTLDFTLVVAMTAQECARYLEYFLEFEGASDVSIKGQYEREFMPRVTQMLTMVRKVSKTDAKTLMNDFTTLKSVVTSSPEELSICQGIGALKAKRMIAAFNAPFKPTARK